MAKVNSFVISAPQVGIPPFLINSSTNPELNEQGRLWYITGDFLGVDAYYSFNEADITAQDVIDNGSIIPISLNGASKMIERRTLNEMKLVFQSGTGFIRIEKAKP